MATSQASPLQTVPPHISGNTTEQQNRMLQEFLGDAVQEAYRTAIEQLDRQSAQAVIDMHGMVKDEVKDRVVEIIRRHTVSDKFKDEEVASKRVYPPNYRVRPIEAQVTELRKNLPTLGVCLEKLSRQPLVYPPAVWRPFHPNSAAATATTTGWKNKDRCAASPAQNVRNLPPAVYRRAGNARCRRKGRTPQRLRAAPG